MSAPIKPYSFDMVKPVPAVHMYQEEMHIFHYKIGSNILELTVCSTNSVVYSLELTSFSEFELRRIEPLWAAVRNSTTKKWSTTSYHGMESMGLVMHFREDGHA